MGRALALREDFTSADLKRLARESRDADQTRRLLALAVIYDGGSRAEAARTGERAAGPSAAPNAAGKTAEQGPPLAR